MIEWEYKIIASCDPFPEAGSTHDADIIEEIERLDFWGKKGWELVAIAPRRGARSLLYLKRANDTIHLPPLTIHKDGTVT